MLVGFFRQLHTIGSLQAAPMEQDEPCSSTSLETEQPCSSTTLPLLPSPIAHRRKRTASEDEETPTKFIATTVAALEGLVEAHARELGAKGLKELTKSVLKVKTGSQALSVVKAVSSQVKRNKAGSKQQVQPTAIARRKGKCGSAQPQTRGRKPVSASQKAAKKLLAGAKKTNISDSVNANRPHRKKH